MSNPIDITGQIVGRLTVLYRDSEKTGNWFCQCQCGKTKSIRGSDLRRRTVKSCGCYLYGGRDVTGERFGRLVAVERIVGDDGRITPVWLCECDCGNTKLVHKKLLGGGSTKSCGCISKEIAATRQKSKNPAYKIWRSSKERALVKGLQHSISVDDPALKSPDVCPVCSTKLIPGILKLHHASPTLDRIDNSIGYVPGNIRIICHRCNTLKSDATFNELTAVWLDSARLSGSVLAERHYLPRAQP